MNSLVTIITPCYNGEAFLHRYFSSILAQTYDALELVFVNDGSEDATESIALSYRQALESRGIRYQYLHQPHGGQAKAMNTGFAQMTGMYLVWPDADDWLEPDSIEKRVRFLQENPQYDFLRSAGCFFDDATGQRTGSVNFYGDAEKEDIFLDLILEKTYCACGCYMIKTAMLREIYPDLRIYESNAGQNWQILIPVAGRGRCGYIHEEQYHVAVRSNSHSRKIRSLDEEVARKLELKKVLLIGIKKSGRQDRDYSKIVERKYQHILFELYARAGEKAQVKAYFAQLESAGDVRPEERKQYLKLWHPARYRFFCAKALARRAAGKVKRILSK